LKQFLIQEFGTLIQVQEMKDRGITGNFEVVIVNSNTLIHSKRSGKATTAGERQAIVDRIRQALEAK